MRIVAFGLKPRAKLPSSVVRDNGFVWRHADRLGCNMAAEVAHPMYAAHWRSSRVHS